MQYSYSLRSGVKKLKTKASYAMSAAVLSVGGLSLALAAPLTAHAASTVTVTPTDNQGWVFLNDNGAGGSGSFVNGPATPPLGSGSAELKTNTGSDGYMLYAPLYGGTRLSDLSQLSYNSYVQQGNNTVAPSLQLDIDADVSDTNTAWQGRLVYEPYYNGTVTDGTWQNWNTLDGKWWFSSPSHFGGMCPQSTPCTLSTIEAAYPNIGVRDVNGGGVGFKAGSGWSVPFVGNVDAFTVDTGTGATTYNFEKVTPDTQAPDVTITNPTNDSTVYGTVDIHGTVTDANPDHYYLVIKNAQGQKVAGPGTVNDTQSFTDQSLYNWDTTQVPDGVYTIDLEARDQARNKDAGSTAVVTVTVNNTVDNSDQCKDGGWANFTKPSFKNQGQCVAYVNHNDGNGADDLHAKNR